MELRSEEEQEKENKGRKIIIIAIILLIAISVLIGVVIVLLKQAENQKIKLSVDGKSKSIPANFILEDANYEKYYAIKNVASFLEYKFYNGEYKKYTEDKTMCYVESNNELAMLELGSNVIYKSNSSSKTNFDEYTIKNSIKIYNDVLYISADGIKVAFNTSVIYNSNTNTIYFESLPYLVNYYKSRVQSYGLELTTDFNTQKALMENMLVISKDKKYGVIDKNSLTTIIGNKYDNIKYVENTGEFIVESDGKTGTLSPSGETKIGLRYDAVGLIDGKNKLYYVKSRNLYGVVNQNGKVLVYTEYENIGINRTLFPIADIKNDMFFYGNCIPLKKDNKWGLADKNGEIILNMEYDSLGYVEKTETVVENPNNKKNSVVVTTAPEKSINNVILIPEIEGIVVGKNNKYGVVDSIGKMIIPCEYNKIYSITNEGKDEIYLEKDGRVIKLYKYLEENKIEIKNPSNNASEDNATDNTTNTTQGNTIKDNNTENNTTNNQLNIDVKTINNNTVKNTTTNTSNDNTMRIIM